MASDGLPILGRIGSYNNAWIATAHSMLGVTLGPATGEAMARYIRGGAEPEVLKPFSASRF